MTDPTSPWSLTRREMLGATVAAFVVPLLSPFSFAARFFTPAEFALVDELSEMIIPTDAHSPGARAARVAGEIDRRLSEATDSDWQERWRSGLRSVDALARETTGTNFLRATSEQRLAILTRMSAGESSPKTPAERFFGQIKGATTQAYYTSKIGIHQDQQYQGNVFQPGEFAGFNAS